MLHFSELQQRFSTGKATESLSFSRFSNFSKQPVRRVAAKQDTGARLADAALSGASSARGAPPSRHPGRVARGRRLAPRRHRAPTAQAWQQLIVDAARFLDGWAAQAAALAGQPGSCSAVTAARPGAAFRAWGWCSCCAAMRSRLDRERGCDPDRSVPIRPTCESRTISSIPLNAVWSVVLVMAAVSDPGAHHVPYEPAPRVLQSQGAGCPDRA